MKKLLIGFTLVTALLSSTLSFADFGKRKVKPAGFDQFFVFMANGVFDPNNPNPGSGAVNCDGLFCDGYYFQSVTMGRSDQEIIEREKMAKDFFNSRFGFDVDSSEFEGRVFFSSFMTNPDWDYRMYVKGTKTKATGWPVRDGGFYALVTDPEGVTLGGDFEGQHAPFNAIVFFGEYNVLLNDRRKKNKEMVIRFQSRIIHQINEDGSAQLRCQLFNDKFGEGYAIVSLDNSLRSDGMIQGRGRNVLTFPPFSSTVDGQPSELDF